MESDIEIKLKNKINSLISMMRVSQYLDKAHTELDCIMTIGNYSQRAYDNPEKDKNFQIVKDSLEGTITKVKRVFGNEIINEAYLCLQELFQDKERLKKVFSLKSVSDNFNFDKVFQDIFNAAKENIDCVKEDTDGYTYWLGIALDIISPVEKIDKDEAENVFCPYCGQIAQKQPGALFVQGIDETAFVWGCQCGAYAYANNNGEIIGTIADASLHRQRTLLKKAIGELCDLEGITLYESYRYFSRCIGKNIRAMKDIEFLDLKMCNAGIHFFLNYKELKKGQKIEYPKSQKELMLFLKNGGRLKILKSLQDDCTGRLLIPISIGETAVLIRSKKSPEQINFPKSLHYEFKNDIMTIVHPSSKRERYRMYSVTSLNKE